MTTYDLNNDGMEEMIVGWSTGRVSCAIVGVVVAYCPAIYYIPITKLQYHSAQSNHSTIQATLPI